MTILNVYLHGVPHLLPFPSELLLEYPEVAELDLLHSPRWL